jgi:hypothetical protein
MILYNMILSIIEVVSYSSTICMILLYDTMHYDQPCASLALVIVKGKKRMKYFFRLQVTYLWQGVRGVEDIGQTRKNFYFFSEGSQ